MGTPSTRTPVRIARGTLSNLNSSLNDLAEGEICWATNENRLYCKETESGTAALRASQQPSDSTKADLASPDFTTDITLKAQAPVKFEDDTGGETIGLKAPTGVTTYEVTLPATAPSSGQVLKASSSSALTWGTDTAVGGATGVDFDDSTKARFGTGNDLELYHDGSNSFVKDTGTGSLKIEASQVELTGGAAAGITTIADGATMTPDFGANCNFDCTGIGGTARTLANPSSTPVAGQAGSIFVGGAGFSTYGTSYKFSGGTAPTTWTNTSGKVDRLDYIVYSSTHIQVTQILNF